MDPTRDPKTDPHVFAKTYQDYLDSLTKGGINIDRPEDLILMIDGSINLLQPKNDQEAGMMMFNSACYVGGNMIKLFGGYWTWSKNQERWIVALKDKREGSDIEANVFHKMEKRIVNGMEESISYWYKMMKKMINEGPDSILKGGQQKPDERYLPEIRQRNVDHTTQEFFNQDDSYANQRWQELASKNICLDRAATYYITKVLKTGDQKLIFLHIVLLFHRMLENESEGTSFGMFEMPIISEEATTNTIQKLPNFNNKDAINEIIKIANKENPAACDAFSKIKHSLKTDIQWVVPAGIAFIYTLLSEQFRINKKQNA